jgi:hypothetical protein
MIVLFSISLFSKSGCLLVLCHIYLHVLTAFTRKKNCSDGVEHTRHHGRKFSCLGNQEVAVSACLNRSPVTGIDNAKTTLKHASHRLYGPSLL